MLVIRMSRRIAEGKCATRCRGQIFDPMPGVRPSVSFWRRQATEALAPPPTPRRTSRSPPSRATHLRSPFWPPPATDAPAPSAYPPPPPPVAPPPPPSPAAPWPRHPPPPP